MVPAAFFKRITLNEHLFFASWKKQTVKPDAADSPYAQAEASLLDININIYTTFYSFRGGSPERLVTLLLLGHLSNLKLRPAVYRTPTISDFSQHLWG